jgi:hypothetical protein
MSKYICRDDAVKQLGCEIVIQMLKDYFHKPTKMEIKTGIAKQYMNKAVIKKQLKSDYLYSLTDGLNLTVLRVLNEDEEKIAKYLKKVIKDEKHSNV